VTPYLKNKQGMVMHTYNPSYFGGRAVEGSRFKASQGKNLRTYLENKQTTSKKGGWEHGSSSRALV
jgi:hypothetical protein